MGRAQHRRVLVAVVAETRAWEITAESFLSNVIEPLGADLALCIGDHEATNPLHRRARYVWRTEEPDDWGPLYDRRAGHGRWRALLTPGAQLLGGIEDPKASEIGSGAIVLYFRQFLADSIEREGIADQYDWLIVTRSDLLWPTPHPPIDCLSPRHIYALDGEGYGGVEDRHLIVPRRHVPRFLKVPDPIFSDPEKLRRELDRISVAQDWPVLNPERFLAARLRRLGLWRRVRFLPYVPYLVRAPGGATRWSPGSFDKELGGYIKYPTGRALADRGALRTGPGIVGALPGTAPRGENEARAEGGLSGARAVRAALSCPGRSCTDRPATTPSRAGQRQRLHRLMAAMGGRLRRIPRAERLLDARIRRIRRRAERRAGRT